MTIDRRGQWWQGTGAMDLDVYLAHHTDGGYAAERVLHAACASAEVGCSALRSTTNRAARVVYAATATPGCSCSTRPTPWTTPSSDGVLGVYTDWKIDYSPTSMLLEQV